MTAATDARPRDAILHGLDASQRMAVTSESAPLAILAGAGSGKTRVLTRRIAWRVASARAEAEHVLAVTFTRKAAGELVNRLARLGVRGRVTAGTVHAIALAQLRRHAADRDREPPRILERKARLLAPLLRGAARPGARRGVPGGPSDAETAVQALELAGEIEWAKARLVGPDRYEDAIARAGREVPRAATEVAELYAAYEREKRRRGLVDFEDLILRAGRLLETEPEFSAVQRWRFRHLFVDEFQDVSPAQLRLVRGWLGDRADLTVVGDPDQAIYGFAGADPGFLARFARVFPGGTVLRLEANYRSTPQVVRAARAVLADTTRRPLPSVRVPQPDGPAPSFTTYPSDGHEARGVARGLRDAHAGGGRWSALAVLYRTNAQSAPFEGELGRRGIPFRVRGAGRFLDRPEVKATLDALKATAGAAPGRPFSEHLTDLVAEASELSEERREHVDALARLGREYLAAEGGPGSVDGFLAFLRASLRGDAGEETGDAVELLTFHRAKGLEFDSVWVTGLERGLVPISFAEAPAERAEERRLLYVALSRAARVLHLSWAQERTIGLRVAKRARSPWLAVVQAASGDGARGAVAPDPKVKLAELRSQLRAGAGGDRDPRDAALLGELVEWRRSVARAARVPAYVVLSNATLEAVATACPRTPAELLAVPGIGPTKLERYGEALLELVGRRSGPAAGRG